MIILGAFVTRIIMAPISDRPWFNQRIAYSTGNVIMSAASLGKIITDFSCKYHLPRSKLKAYMRIKKYI